MRKDNGCIGEEIQTFFVEMIFLKKKRLSEGKGIVFEIVFRAIQI